MAGVGMSMDDMRRMARWGGHAMLPAVARATAAVAAVAELARLKALRKVTVVSEVRLISAGRSIDPSICGQPLHVRACTLQDLSKSASTAGTTLLGRVEAGSQHQRLQ